MKKLRIFLFACGTVALLGAAPLKGQENHASELAHSGGTDKCGCHYNRKTGQYHCHNRKQRGGDCPA